MRFRTSSSMRALFCGGKYLATYSLPIASPIAPSMTVMPRFQRGRFCGMPRKLVPVNPNRSSTKAFERQGAAAES